METEADYERVTLLLNRLFENVVIARRAETDGACRERGRTAIHGGPLGLVTPLCL